MSKPYSKRNAPANDVLRYDLPELLKSRILFTVQERIEHDVNCMHGRCSMASALEQVAKKALRQYGGLQCNAGDRMDIAAIKHFNNTTVERALDFLEFLLESVPTTVGELLVVDINDILQEEGIGYELTPMRAIYADDDPSHVEDRKSSRPPGADRGDHSASRPKFGVSYKISYPTFIRKDTEYLHSEVVRPCLEALATPGFETASSEMMKAHEAYRKGHYTDAITDAGSSFESVLKTVCSMKGWPYNPDRDTCSTLVKTCKDNGLIPSFYAPMFVAVGTLRNKLSDAHGRGPAPLFTVEKDHADHMIQMTSAHITFLIKRAR